MNRILTLAATAALMAGASAPAQAAFYFEGLMPYTDAPNCNDPYATTCGRYGQVPHTPKVGKKPYVTPRKDPKMNIHPPKMPQAPKPGVRYQTREGLEK